MEHAEEMARDRAHEGVDTPVVRAAKRWTLIHFGGDVQRAAWFFDELARWE